MAAQLVRAERLVSIKRERTRTTLIPYGIANSLVTPMDDAQSRNPIDAAAEITDAMMSSLADVVKNVISTSEDDAEVDVQTEASAEETPDEQTSEEVKD